jgi:glycosyltransferase involved in cell wall biosynthesis
VTTSPQLLSSLDLIKFKSSNIIPLGIPYQDIRQPACIVEKSYALYFGRLADYKGIDYLLDAIKALPHISFVIAGQGPLSTLVCEFIARHNLTNVRFINEQISEEQKIALIRGCSFLIFPSTTKNEAFGIVQLEAMREGKPIVNTMLDNGVNFVAPDGLCAISCPPKDSASLSIAINSIWTDNSLRSVLSDSARRRFEENFTSDKFADLWSRLLNNIAGRS